jgi:hypothetical protein
MRKRDPRIRPEDFDRDPAPPRYSSSFLRRKYWKSLPLNELEDAIKTNRGPLD